MPLTKDFFDSIRIVPVLVIDSADDAVHVAEALYAGGMKAIEITLRTPAALSAIEAIKRSCPDIIVGAGTVITEEHIEQVVDLGVDFAVSPGLSLRLLQKAHTLEVDLLPGVTSPSEVILGMEEGHSVFKLFPASAVGGLAWLKSMQGPLPEIHFCATGGINMDNFSDYLALSNVICVGGSWLVPKGAIEAKDWSAITEIARSSLAKLNS